MLDTKLNVNSHRSEELPMKRNIMTDHSSKKHLELGSSFMWDPKLRDETMHIPLVPSWFCVFHVNLQSADEARGMSLRQQKLIFRTV